MIATFTTFTTDSLAQGNPAVWQEPAPEAVFGSYSVLSAPAKKPAEPAWRDAPSGIFEGFLSLGVMCLFLLLFRYVRNFFSTLMNGLFNFLAAEKQFNENSLSVVITSRILSAFSFISIGFFIWLAALRTGWITMGDDLQWEYFWMIIGILAVFFIVKFSLLRIVEFVSKNAPVMQLIVFFNRLHCIACGFLLLPVILLMVASRDGVFFHSLTIAGFSVLLFFMLLYILRVIRIFLTARISIFFLILYLCTFEIAPFLLLYSFILLD
ncbi:MAG: DUF4271 domain-containing protein [Prevotellaceae bacterium]|jgi:hypothetical protein|nr:DUF4271 domain-containing protein [Prevotellaceae bacterium]